MPVEIDIDQQSFLIRHNVNLREFYLKNYSNGWNNFEGSMFQPVYQAKQTAEMQNLSGWGCGIQAIYNLFNATGFAVDLHELIQISQFAGASIDYGMDWPPIQTVFNYYGYLSTLKELTNISDAENLIKTGWILLVSNIAGDLGRTYSSHGYDSHWFVVNGAGAGKVSVIDSSLRPSGINNVAFGTYALAWSDFMRVSRDFYPQDNGFLSASEDFVWGLSLWSTQHIVAAVRRSDKVAII